MKFFCEYCGARIDAEVDKCCPNCKAPYTKNKTFMELEKKKKEQEDFNQEMKKETFNAVKKGFKIFGSVHIVTTIISFIIIFGVIITIIFTAVGINKRFSENNSNNGEDIINDMISEEDDIQENVTAEFNEYAEVEGYKFKVTGYEVVTFWYKDPEPGYEFVKFNLMVENTSGKRIRKENVNCIVNGIAQVNDFTSGYSDLPTYIEKDLTVTGTSTFSVPKDATEYNIKYGDYITIHIKK